MKYICLTDDYPGFTLGKVYEAEFEVHSTTIPNYNKFRTKDDQGHSRLPSKSQRQRQKIIIHVLYNISQSSTFLRYTGYNSQSIKKPVIGLVFLFFFK
jgi:hypothetical protein